MHLRALALTLVCGLVLSAPASAAPQGSLLGPEQRAFRKQLNAYRVDHGLARLKRSAPLTKAAKWMSNDMARKDYFDHTDSLGRGYAARIAGFGFHGSSTAENLGAGVATATDALDQWKRPGLSQRNLLNPTFKVIGIARAFAPRSTFGWYWTASFGDAT